MRNGRRILVLGVLACLPLLFVGLSALVIQTIGESGYVLCVGIVITVSSAMSARASLARRHWPTTDGMVTHSAVKTTPGLFGWRDPEQDRVTVEYSYMVDDNEYTGSFRCLPTNDSILQQIGGLVREGTAITVHYNPRAPSESSLVVKGPGSLNLCFLLFGLAGIVGGCFLVWK